MLVATITIAAGCGSSEPTQQQANNAAEEEEEELNTRHNPVFSLFDSDGQGSYLLFRNDSKIASFTLDAGKKPLGLCSHNDDCYILVSGAQAKDTTDTASHNAEILKNSTQSTAYAKTSKCPLGAYTHLWKTRSFWTATS